MKRLAPIVVALIVAGCSSTNANKKEEVVLTDVEFWHQCMDANGDNESHCKQQYIKRKIGFQCDAQRGTTTGSRIRKKECTTASQRENIKQASEIFLRDMRRLRVGASAPQSTGT